MGKPESNWDAREIMLLRMGWHVGLSANFISDVVGSRSRNAVIGKAHRLHLAERVAGAHNSIRRAAEEEVIRVHNVELARKREERERREKQARLQAAMNHRPRGSNMCREVLTVDAGGHRVYCRSTAQPGRRFCAEHLPKPPRTRNGQIGKLSVGGASSMVW